MEGGEERERRKEPSKQARKKGRKEGRKEKVKTVRLGCPLLLDLWDRVKRCKEQNA